MVRGKGTGFVSIEGSEEDVVIERDALGFALDGDLVEISVKPLVAGKRLEGAVVKVVKRTWRELIGAVKERDVAGKKLFYLSPDNHRIHVRPTLPTATGNDLGMKVAVELTTWTDAKVDPTATIIEVLGRVGDHETEMQAIIRSGGFTKTFPEAVQTEAHALYEKREQIFAAALADPKRRDMRTALTMTIDPVDAKDFDDALSLTTLPNGNYEIGIHIADVSHYVTLGSLLDDEAKERGTSIYLVDRVIPMLPEVLSNDVCSLNPHEDKLTFSAVFVIDDAAHIHTRWFGRTVINSTHRFTYETAQAAIDGVAANVTKYSKGIQPVELAEAGMQYAEPLITLNRLAKILQKQKFAQGAIEFEQEEIKFRLDFQGRPIGVYVYERLDTHKLVEEYMLSLIHI